jgi:hypothetical protein
VQLPLSQCACSLIVRHISNDLRITGVHLTVSRVKAHACRAAGVHAPPRTCGCAHAACRVPRRPGRCNHCAGALLALPHKQRR